MTLWEKFGLALALVEAAGAIFILFQSGIIEL